MYTAAVIVHHCAWRFGLQLRYRTLRHGAFHRALTTPRDEIWPEEAAEAAWAADAAEPTPGRFWPVGDDVFVRFHLHLGDLEVRWGEPTFWNLFRVERLVVTQFYEELPDDMDPFAEEQVRYVGSMHVIAAHLSRLVLYNTPPGYGGSDLLFSAGSDLFRFLGEAVHRITGRPRFRWPLLDTVEYLPSYESDHHLGFSRPAPDPVRHQFPRLETVRAFGGGRHLRLELM